MAIPTFTSATPNSGYAGGGAIIDIVGTNFNCPTVFLDNWDSVGVEFNGIQSSRVDVLSNTALKVWVPPYQGENGSFADNPIPTVDVRIYNIDEDGNTIAGESVTETVAFLYQRVAVRSPRATRASQIYVEILANAIWTFGRQIVPSVSIGTSVDFGEAGFSTPKVANIPAVALVGPRIEEDMVNRHRWEGLIEEDDAIYADTFVANFELDAVLASNNKQELYGMVQGLIRMFKRTPYLKIPIDPDAPNDGYHSFPFALVDPPIVAVADANSDLVTATATFQIRRIPYTLDDPFEDGLYEVLNGYIQMYDNIDFTGTAEIINFADSD